MRPAAAGLLALAGLLVPAVAQTPGAQTGGQPKGRLLVVRTPPLADEQLPEGGLVVALVRASLGRTDPAPGADKDVRWSGTALTPEILNEPTVGFALPVESADCDRPNDLTRSSAVLCDSAIFSDPILQVVIGLFTLTNSTFKFETDQSIYGKTICLSRDHDLSALNGNGRNWASYKRLVVLRRPTLLDCVAAVQARDADAFVTTDLEGSYLLRRLGLTPFFTMQARPLATRGVHAVASREHERSPDLIAALNLGLQRLKEGDAYSAIIQRHIMAMATPSAPAAPPPHRETAALAPPAASAKPPPKPAALPVLDAKSREVALRFLKRGNEELVEGRIAPARLLFERAAEMGLAQAAMAMAATYDAVELNQPQLRNVLPNAAEAKRWYERAAALGASDAAARLQRLGSK